VKILVDTTIWSLSLRRARKRTEDMHAPHVSELAELVRDGRAVLVGPVRQEILSGIGDPALYERLRASLRAFPDEPLDTSDYEGAARASNTCRTRGIVGSPVDFLLCAVAIARSYGLYTTDRDFDHYAKHLPLRLHAPRSDTQAPGSL